MGYKVSITLPDLKIDIFPKFVVQKWVRPKKQRQS